MEGEKHLEFASFLLDQIKRVTCNQTNTAPLVIPLPRIAYT